MNEVLHEIQYVFREKIDRSVFLDLAKVFNTVNHKNFISKLKRYDIKGSMLNLLKDYLKDRSKSTVINNVVSERETVNVGIPQGSCLGPLMFFCVY